MTPSPKLALYAGLCILLLCGVLAIVSFISDPFGIRSWFADREKDRVAHVESDLSARTIEGEAQRELIVRIESAGRLQLDLSQVTAEAVNQARDATDANAPLEAGLAARLHDNDQRLCQLRPGVCASADTAPAGD